MGRIHRLSDGQRSMIVSTILIVIVVSCLSFLLLKAAGDAEAASIPFSDDFDDGKLDNWTKYLSRNGVVDLVTNVNKSAPYSLHIKAASDYDEAEARPNITADSTYNYIVELDFRLGTQDHHWIEIWHNYEMNVVLDQSRKIIARELVGSGATNTYVTTINTNTWYHIKIKWNATTKKSTIWVDGVQKLTFNVNKEFTYTRVGDVYSTENKGEAWWDNIEVYYEAAYPYKPTLVSPANGAYLNATPTLEWKFLDPNAGDTQTAYQLQIDDVSGFTSPDVDTGTVASASSSYTPSALAYKTWYWRVKTRDNTSLWSGWSNTFSFTMDDSDPPVVGRPTDEGTWTNSTTLKWNWTAPTDPSGISGYYVCIGTQAGATDVVRDAWVTSTSYNLTGAVTKKTYYCKVKAKDGAGNVGAYSTSSDGITVDLDKPVCQQPLDDPPYTNSTTLGWKWAGSDAGSGIASYYVRVGTTPGGNNIVDGASTTSATYSTTVLGANMVYYCTVRALDVVGNLGDWSAPSNGATLDIEAPSTVVIQDAGMFNNNGTLVFTWTAATDNLSGVLGYLLDIGTSVNGTNVANAMFVTSTRFEYPYGKNKTTYYARVRAVDRAGNVGAYSNPTDGITVDLSGPLANLVRDEGRWSNITWLTFAWEASLDPVSGIEGYYLYIGSSPGSADVMGGLFVPGTSYVFKGAVDGRSYYAWVKARDGAGNIGPAGPASDGITVDTTAPASMRPTDDGDWSTSPLLTWTWTASVDLTSGVRGYQVNVGTTQGGADVVAGKMVSATSLSISMAADGASYYCSIRALDWAGNAGTWSPSSDGIAVDLTAPLAATPQDGGTWSTVVYVNFTWVPSSDDGSGLSHYRFRAGSSPGGSDLETVVRVDTDWFNLTGLVDGTVCYAQVRAVDVAGNVGPWSPASDGIMVDVSSPGAVTVTDGGVWSTTSSSTWTWSAATDTISGTASYLVDLGTAAGSSDTLSNVTVTTASLTHSGLSEGSTYYCRARAVDGAGNTGPWSKWTDGITVDTTPPGMSSVLDHGDWSTASTLVFTWSAAADATSGVAGYYVYVGTAAGSSDVISGVFVTGRSYTLTGGQGGLTYYCNVMAMDKAGNTGAMGTWSDGITVDVQAPVAQTPWDDGVWQTGSTMFFRWPEASDPHSGVKGYHVTVGTSPRGNDVLDNVWTTLREVSLTSLLDGSTYYCMVRAEDNAGNVGPWSAPSDGITVDMTPPSVPFPDDPGQWSPDPYPVFTWTPSSDTISGLAGYEVKVGTTSGGDDVVSTAWVTTVWYSLGGTVEGTTYYLCVRGVDAAGNRGLWSPSTDGVTVDTTPPMAVSVIDDSEWSREDWLLFDWMPASDAISGVSHYLVDVGTAPDADDAVSGFRASTHEYRFFGAMEGVTYYCSVRPVDGAGNVGARGPSSDGITVDTTAPLADRPMVSRPWSTTGNATWSWPPTEDGGSGMQGYYVSFHELTPYSVTRTLVDIDDLTLNLNSMYEYVMTNLSHGKTYYITLEAVDVAGNVGPVSEPSAEVVVDKHVPSVLSVRDEGEWSNDPYLDFSWTPVVDPVSGLAGYRISIGTSPGGANILDSHDVVDSSYRYMDGESGLTYYLSVTAVDMAGNVAASSPTTDGVTVDLRPPTAGPARDAGEWSGSSLLTFVWDAPQQAVDRAFAHVSVGVSPGVPVHGAVLSGDETSYTFSGGMDGVTYYAWVRFEDEAGNVGLPGGASDGVTVDLSPPSAVVVKGPGLSVPPGSMRFTWSEATDGTSGVAAYQVQVTTSSIPSSTPTSVDGTEYTFQSGVPGASYMCFVRAVDAAGNLGPWSSTDGTVAIYQGSPQLTLVIAGGAEVTSSPMVSVQVECNDTVAPAMMRISQDPAFADVSWELFRSNVVIMLDDSDGDHTVYVQVLNELDIIGEASGSIVLDTRPPHVTFVSEQGDTTRSATYTAFGQTEPGAVLTHNGAEVSVGPDGGFSLDVPLVLGANTVELVAEDAAGNVGSATLTVYREVEPEKDWTPTALAFSIMAFVAVVVLIVLLVYLIFKRRTTVMWDSG